MPRIEALLDAIEALGCTDPDRVYATGVSNGGGFAARLGCELADRHRGRRAGRRRLPRARPLPAGPAHVAARDPRPGRPRRALPRASPPDFKGNVPRFVARWARRDGCSPARSHPPVTRRHPPALPRLRGRHGRRAHRDRGPRPRLGRQGRARRRRRQRGDLEVLPRRRAVDRPPLNESDAKASRSRSPPADPPKRSDSRGGGPLTSWPRSLRLTPSRREETYMGRRGRTRAAARSSRNLRKRFT